MKTCAQPRLRSIDVPGGDRPTLSTSVAYVFRDRPPGQPTTGGSRRGSCSHFRRRDHRHGGISYIVERLSQDDRTSKSRTQEQVRDLADEIRRLRADPCEQARTTPLSAELGATAPARGRRRIRRGTVRLRTAYGLTVSGRSAAGTLSAACRRTPMQRGAARRARPPSRRRSRRSRPRQGSSR